MTFTPSVVTKIYIFCVKISSLNVLYKFYKKSLSIYFDSETAIHKDHENYNCKLLRNLGVQHHVWGALPSLLKTKKSPY